MVEAYESAKSSGLPVGELNGRQVEGFKSALATIESEVAYSNTVIDMLLLNTSDRSVNGPHAEVVNLAPIVHEAVDRYPFNNSYERSLVSITVEEDFSVFAPRLLLVHVIFNLLKNGIYHAQKKPTGRVSIVIRCNQGSGIIEVTDTGAGMSAITRRQVFDRFFTTAGVGQGTGVGLSFCKMVMESVGGSIHCESKEGRYTTFRLTFPEYSQNLQPETA